MSLITGKLCMKSYACRLSPKMTDIIKRTFDIIARKLKKKKLDAREDLPLNGFHCYARHIFPFLLMNGTTATLSINEKVNKNGNTLNSVGCRKYYFSAREVLTFSSYTNLQRNLGLLSRE